MMTGKYDFNDDREILSIFPYVYHFYLGAVHVLHEGNRELLLEYLYLYYQYSRWLMMSMHDDRNRHSEFESITIEIVEYRH